jgi:hypothetical protein
MEALHSFGTLYAAKIITRMMGGIVIKCIIPAGSNYYIGTFKFNIGNKCHEYKSYASDCLKYVSVVK